MSYGLLDRGWKWALALLNVGALDTAHRQLPNPTNALVKARQVDEEVGVPEDPAHRQPSRSRRT